MNGHEFTGYFRKYYAPKEQKEKDEKFWSKIILEKEEAEKLIDMEAVVKEAVRRTENTGIVFVDEVDKIASKGGAAAAGRKFPAKASNGIYCDCRRNTVNTRYAAGKNRPYFIYSIRCFSCI